MKGKVGIQGQIKACLYARLVLRATGWVRATTRLALLLAGLFCHLAGLDDGLRSAYICVVIIIGVDRFAARSPPMGRVAAVAVGSAIGVGVSWVYARIEAWPAARRVTEPR